MCKYLVDNYFSFCDNFIFCISLRPIIFDSLLKKYGNINDTHADLTKILESILKEGKREDLLENLMPFIINPNMKNIEKELISKFTRTNLKVSTNQKEDNEKLSYEEGKIIN